MSASPAVALWQGECYARSAMVLTFALHGLPIAQGSKSYKGQTRAGRAILVESSKALKPWRLEVQRSIEAAIRAAAPPACGFPLVGPVAVDLVFTMPKPKSAPKTRITYPIVKPDLDKLFRAVLDAATYAGLFGDDSQVVDSHVSKVYPRETPRALAQPGLMAAVHVIGAQPVSRGDVQLLLTDEASA